MLGEVSLTQSTAAWGFGGCKAEFMFRTRNLHSIEFGLKQASLAMLVRLAGLAQWARAAAPRGHEALLSVGGCGRGGQRNAPSGVSWLPVTLRDL